MSSNLFDLSEVVFTRRADIVNSGETIFNPEHSTVRTLRGDDQIIGSSSISYDLGVSIKVAAEEIGLGINPVNSAEFIFQAEVNVDGIINRGDIYTNAGRDIVSGSAIAQVKAEASTVSEAIAIANTVDATAIAKSLASVEVAAIANGINNSGKIYTDSGSDTVAGEVTAAIAAVAKASIDVTSIVTAIAQAPTSDGLKAVAAGLATSLAKAEVVATGLNNNYGEVRTGGGADNISATATSYSANYAEAQFSGFTTANPGNQTLLIGVIEAIAQTEDIAIGIGNEYGDILTGYGADTIEATANAYDKAIAIYNSSGYISLGSGKDKIEAIANAYDKAIAIDNNNGYINLDSGKDIIEAAADASENAIAIDNSKGHINLDSGKDIIEASANAYEKATAIDNTNGYIGLGAGKDIIEAIADVSILFNDNFGNILSEYQTDTIEATANVSDEAIAIDNNNGYINLGSGKDNIKAIASNSSKAIAIDNEYGDIVTGNGADTIEAYASGNESYGIYGGNISTSNGDDVLKTSSFGGGVNINMGSGTDYIQGFGDATVYGGNGFDTISFGSYNKSEFNIYTDNGFTMFELSGTIMEISGFEKYVFADGDYSFYNLIA